MFSDIFKPSVPDYFSSLFAIEKKSELEKYSKELLIRSDELVQLILHSPLIGYLHNRRHHEFQPDQAQLTPEDIDILRKQETDKLPKFAAKVRNLFATRKYLSAHLFYNATRWHLFYFTFRDVEDEENNHWKHGSHVHFFNDLWPEYCIDQLDELLFTSRTTKVNSLHIRYEDTRPSRNEPMA